MLNVVQVSANSKNYGIGRNSCAVLAVYLHGVDQNLFGLDAMACRRQGNIEGASYHYAVEGQIVHQYVDVANTAYSFGPTAANPAIPGKPITCTDDESTINIAIPRLLTDSLCSDDQTYAQDTLKTLCLLLADLERITGLVLDVTTVLFNTINLPDFPIADVLACKNATLTAVPVITIGNISTLPVFSGLFSTSFQILGLFGGQVGLINVQTNGVGVISVV